MITADDTGSVDENDAGATITAVTTENATSVSVDNDHFEVADGNLKLKDDSTLDFEAVDGGTVAVTITASGDGESATHTVTVTVNDVNESPHAPEVVGDADDLSVDENDEGATVTSLEAPMDPDDGDVVTFHVDDDRFEVTDARILKLKDGMSLDYETETSVTLTLTAMDDDETPLTSEATTITVMVNDLNEAPDVSGMAPDITPNAGEEFYQEVKLYEIFDDKDAGDGNLTYELKGGPAWLAMTIRLDADGPVALLQSVATSGANKGKPAAVPLGEVGTVSASIVAKDDGGGMSEAPFHVVTDDGNDAITAINLYHMNADGSDGDKNVLYQVEIDETPDDTTSSEVNLGRLTVDDIDDPAHPHGTHKLTVGDKRFDAKQDDSGDWWLVLKAGQSVNYEKDPSITVTVTAKDNAGKGMTATQDVVVTVHDKNDAPTALDADKSMSGNQLGNWWVTLDEDLEAEDVNAGDWLSFALDTDGTDDTDAAFTDVDAGDKLKYELSSGPSWLEINATSGAITNKKGMLATPGVYDVTVKATDSGKASAMASFKLTVAVSGANNEDNDSPDIKLTSSNDVNEGPGKGITVGNLTVSDDDNNLTGHPHAVSKVEIVSVVNADNTADAKNATLQDHDSNPSTPMVLHTDTDGDATTGNAGYGAAFELSNVSMTGTNWTYVVKTTDKAKALLDHETVNDITITVRVTDGAGETDDVEIGIDVDDVNEAPKYVGAAATKTITVEQSAAEKTTNWIKLFDVWEDQDDNDDDNDLDYGVTEDTSWIKVVHKPSKWEDIAAGPDGLSTTTDDNVAWGGDPNDPAEDDEWVTVIEIDRTGANNDQASVASGGSYTLTATDDSGAEGSQKVTVKVTDQQLEIAAADRGPNKALKVSGTAREGNMLVATFDETKDPDLAGADSSLIVVYTWTASDVGDNNSLSNTVTRQVSTSNKYMLTQSDVDKQIGVTVQYVEVENFPTATKPEFSAVLPTGTDVTGNTVTTANAGGKVANAPDPGKVSFQILAKTAENKLEAEVKIEDEDGVDYDDSDDPDPNPRNGDDHGTAPVYTWQVSDNGTGGWTTADAEDDTDDMVLDLADGKGKYYRLVVTYQDNGGVNERHASEAMQVGKLAAPLPLPAVVGSANVGGTLSISNAEGASVQWQMDMDPANDATDWQDIAGATGSLNVTSDYAGANLRALVTYSGSKGVTAVAEVRQSIGGSQTNNGPVKLDDHEIEASVDDGKVTTVMDMVPLDDLFQDPDSARLTYTVSATGTAPSNEVSETGITTYFGRSDNGVIYFEPSTGKLVYHTDDDQGHDGTSTDGTGNVVSFTVNASDDENPDTGAQATVGIRLNVKPTDINVTPVNTTVTEEVKQTADLHVADLDVQDENDKTKSFGMHTITVDDDRFTVKQLAQYKPGGSDPDGSQWQLFLKKGAKLDYEADGKAGVFTVKVTATDGGGKKVTDSVGITITNDTDDDADDPTPSNVPGLNDDASDADGDDRTDTTGDGDEDGGWHPPADPGMMSIGGLIEDFVDNMHGFEQDLFEDFMLVIDDIDIA